MPSKFFLRAAVAAAAMVAAPQAQAVNFVLTNTGGAELGTRARQGFEIATSYWSSVLRDNATINLNIGFSTLGATTLGSTGSTRSLLSMTQYYGLAAADQSSALDLTAVTNLPTFTGTRNSLAGVSGTVSAVANAFNNGVNATNGYTDLSTRIDNDNTTNNGSLAVTKASAKALGALTDINNAAINYASSDGSITFNNLFLFDFDPTDGIESNMFDFIGVAIHEIGHALGFVSGVDSYDSRTAPGQTAAANLTSTEGFVTLSQLDLFRYSDAAIAQGVGLDWSTQNTPFFSIDGRNQLFGDSRMSQGVLNGDGRQASHFKDSPSGSPQLGILDPTSGRGQMQEVTALDLAAYDAIGYNVSFDVLANSGYRFTTAQAYSAFVGQATPVVPEPATWAMMIAGFGLVGGAMRRRRTAVAFAG